MLIIAGQKNIIAGQKKTIAEQKRDRAIIAEKYLDLSIGYKKMLDAALHITKAYEKKCAQPAGKKTEERTR